MMSYELPDRLARGIQANILKPHNRNWVAFLFFCWPPGQSAQQYRSWVRKMSTSVTTHAEQDEDSRRYREAIESKKAKLPQSFVINLGLTYSAYREMDLLNELPADPYLKQGMLGKEFFPRYNNGHHVKDPLAKFFREQPNHHVVISVAHDKVKKLRDKVAKLVDYSTQNLPETLVQVEEIEPNRLPPKPGSAKGQAFGPFGFRDGISNPRDLEEHIRFAFGTSDITELEARKQLGTYLAMQKIICRVGKFHILSRKLRDTINGATNKKITTPQAKALLVGRHKNGAPLDRFFKAPKRPMKMEELTDFDYQNGHEGQLHGSNSRCPFHAHIRRVNPRENGAQIKPIIRRGITYHERSPRGWWQQSLLFISMQSSLEQDLVPMYKCMFAKKPQDALTYSARHNGLITKNPKLSYHLKYGDPNGGTVEFDHIGGQITSFVTGAFYYMPDRNFLQQL